MTRNFIVSIWCACCMAAGAQQAARVPSRAPENEIFRENMSKVVLRVDYEGGTLESAGDGIKATWPAAKDAFAISDQKPRSGQFCLRTKVANTDDYISDGKHRAETGTARLAAYRHNEGDVFRYQFSFRLQEDWQFDSRDSIDIIWQFKRFGGQPDGFVAVKGKDVVLRSGREAQGTLLENCKAGEWIDVCIIVRWSPGANGFVEGFAKRATGTQFKKMVVLHGPNMRDAKPDSSYLKWGIYKPGAKNSIATKPHVIYHDEIIVEKMVSAATQ
jgi:hypothetical protein